MKKKQKSNRFDRKMLYSLYYAAIVFCIIEMLSIISISILVAWQFNGVLALENILSSLPLILLVSLFVGPYIGRIFDKEHIESTKSLTEYEIKKIIVLLVIQINFIFLLSSWLREIIASLHPIAPLVFTLISYIIVVDFAALYFKKTIYDRYAPIIKRVFLVYALIFLGLTFFVILIAGNEILYRDAIPKFPEMDGNKLASIFLTVFLTPLMLCLIFYKYHKADFNNALAFFDNNFVWAAIFSILFITILFGGISYFQKTIQTNEGIDATQTALAFVTILLVSLSVGLKNLRDLITKKKSSP